MNVVTMRRMALLAGAVALTATLLAQQPDDPTPQPLPEAVAAESDFVPAPIAPSPVLPPDFPAAEAPPDVGTPIPEPRPAEAAHNPARASAPRETILLEFDPESNTIVTSGTRSEFVEKIKSSLDETKSEEGATSTPIQEATVVIKARPELNHTVLVALINQLKSFGFGRFALGASTDGRNTIKAELPESVSYGEVEQLKGVLLKQKDFQCEVQVGSLNIPVHSTRDSGSWSGDDGAGEEVRPQEIVRRYMLQHVNAESVVQTLKSLYPDSAMAIQSDERMNAVIVRGTEQTQQVIEKVLEKIEGSPTARKTTIGLGQTVGDEDEYESFTLSIQVGSPDNKRELQQRFNSFESHAQQLAMQIQKLKNAGGSQTNEINRLTRELRSAVRQAFTIRQSLHRAELVEYARRLETIQQSIANRDALADQIIEHRVEELLDPNLKWTVAPGVQLTQQVPSGSNTLGSPIKVDGVVVFPARPAESHSYVARVPVAATPANNRPASAEMVPRQQQPSAESTSSASSFRSRYVSQLSRIQELEIHIARLKQDAESNDPKVSSFGKTQLDAMTSRLAQEQAALDFLNEEYATQVKLYKLQLDRLTEEWAVSNEKLKHDAEMVKKGYFSSTQLLEAQQGSREIEIKIELLRTELDLFQKALPKSSGSTED
ncbi:MAG: secretin N-terminal domain-containing protein [Planctomycetaceae bacterium]